MKSKNIVVLTGAGTSAESGIDTFRSAGGLWEQHKVEDVATPEGYFKDPKLVHHFYNLRRAALKNVKPNAAHEALARLETELAECGGNLTIVTQNVDDLHERAGTKNIIHMHGILTSMLCGICEHRWHWAEASSTETLCPSCHVKGSPRPDIVWFGEIPYHMDTIEKAIEACDLFVSIGTSGAVFPASGFVQMARALVKDTLELNLETTQGSHFFHESRFGPAGTLVPEWAEELVRET